MTTPETTANGPGTEDTTEHPGDRTVADLRGKPMWRMDERLELADGTTLVQAVAVLPYEPHLGDVMDTCGFRVEQMLAAAKEDGVLRFLPDHDGVFFAPLGNVVGIYVDVYRADGAEIPAASLKPGRYREPCQCTNLLVEPGEEEQTCGCGHPAEDHDEDGVSCSGVMDPAEFLPRGTYAAAGPS